MARWAGRRGTLPVALLLVGLLADQACSPPPAAPPGQEAAAGTTVELGGSATAADGPTGAWSIAASSAVEADGASISTPGFDDAGWTETTVPTTVLAALARSGETPDPYFDMGLTKIDPARFEQPWWYRTEFAVERSTPGARLVFQGINYSADIWLNGQRIADRTEIFGAFRMFELDIASELFPPRMSELGGSKQVATTNALAVLVYPPRPGDPTIGFVDWNPTPPDRSMGLWRGVELRLTGAVALDRVFVESDLDLDTLDSARLTVSATVRNDLERDVEATIEGEIGDGIRFEKSVELAPGESRRVTMGPDELEQLVVDEPRLWWPNGLGEPELYDLSLVASVDGEVSDAQRLSFGIRHVDDYLTEDGYRGYRVNGREVPIRGGGWVDDLMLADTDRKVEDQIRYVRHMNLNTIRLEGFWGNSRAIFDLADRYGILVMVGWSCQWEWEEYLGAPVDEFGGIDSPEEIDVVTRSLRDQVVWLRNHPSVLVWVLASDMLPRPSLESSYREALADVDPTRPVLAACSVRDSEVSGPSGVKMNGPYEWVPPSYWYLDSERGGAYGFNTETSPGAQPPPLRSIRRMLPESSWWPMDELWKYHCGRHEFHSLDRYTAALEARYGEATSLEDFARKAQLVNYEGVRAMFEAFSLRRPQTTGLIQWMLNSAWPEMYWQLYDHYLVPNGAFFGAMHASRPVNVGFDYRDRTIVAVNDTAEPREDAAVRVRLIGLDSTVLFDETRTLDLRPWSRSPVLAVPTIDPASGSAYFVDARIHSTGGEEITRSFYWLSTTEDILDWEASTWFYTPTVRYADLTALASLPPVELVVDHRLEPGPDGTTLEVDLSNPSDRLAFFVELAVVGAESDRLAAPILWSDNYVSLLPGESRRASATIPAHALTGEAPRLVYSGVNVVGPD
jgi:exo-1,4-beta-D-glucosaminidase